MARRQVLKVAKKAAGSARRLAPKYKVKHFTCKEYFPVGKEYFLLRQKKF